MKKTLAIILCLIGIGAGFVGGYYCYKELKKEEPKKCTECVQCESENCVECEKCESNDNYKKYYLTVANGSCVSPDTII